MSSRDLRCDGLNRRDFVGWGSWGAFGLGTLPLRKLIAAGPRPPAAKNCILIWLDGGPSHLETFDPKPEAPAEVRGPMASIPSSISGIRLGECLPELARRLSQVTLLRGVTSPLGEHNLGTQYLLTGHRPSPTLDYPVIGCAVSHLSPPGRSLPAHVAIPNHWVGGARLRPNGFLPAGCLPFEISREPKPKELIARQLLMSAELNHVRIQRRADWVQQLDRFAESLDRIGQSPPDDSLRDAVTLLTSPDARKAFDLEAEPASSHQRFGPSLFGQSCLLARRLVESGVRFVTVNYSGWDTHDNLVVRLKDGYAGAPRPVGLIPNLDQGVSALIDDLRERGRLDETLLVVMGEFGRTPKINPRGGRDHWPRAFSVLLAGGGTPAGLVHGESDETGESPRTGVVSPADLVATIYSLMGIDPSQELQTADGRPIRLVRDGSTIAELLRG